MRGFDENIGKFFTKIGEAKTLVTEKNKDSIKIVCVDKKQRYKNLIKKVNNFRVTAKNGTEATIYGLTRHLNDEDRCYTIGDHLYVQRWFYTHHGIYVGNGRVVHYLKEQVTETSLADFACGEKIFVKTDEQSPRVHRKRDAIKRAYSRLGENRYNLAINNCDHFVRWCRSGI